LAYLNGSLETFVQNHVVRRRPPITPWIDRAFIAGIAGVFLVNAAVAALDPGAFTALMASSPVGGWFGLDRAAWLPPVIAINDLAIGVGVIAVQLARRQRTRSLVMAWAGCWLLVVTVVKLTALDL
jgi:hypothetical protein